ncbi:MAG: ATP-binding protein, partial [Rhodocyclaceae bacterium]|nr:ATP-binding protein [Rhodocyclaceae bacterium]
LEIENTHFSPAQLVKGVVELLSVKAREQETTLDYHIDPTLPAWLVGDPVRLRQVLLNLVGNAVKFTRCGAVTITVAAERTPSAARLRCTVQDTGIGIAPEAQARLFQSFTQADSSTTRKYGGTGLGLAISKRLVELMDGEIGLTSEVGQGSTFWFVLPLIPAPDIAPTAAAEEERSDAPAPLGEVSGEPAVRLNPLEALENHRLILLAEDNPTNQRVAQMMLGKLGYAVHIVGNGQEAVEAAEALPYAAILMDCQMPVLDGFEATAMIRRNERTRQRHLPIIAMTANAMAGDRERCLAAGMDDYLSKPIQPEALAEKLARWCGDAALPRPPAPTGSADFDVAKLVEFLGDDRAMIVELLEIFRSSTVSLLEKIAAALARADAGALKALAHEAKGASGNLGITAMSQIAARLERAAEAGEWTTARQLSAELSQTFAALQPRLRDPFAEKRP